MPKKFRYQLLRFAADLIRAEYKNFGIILQTDDELEVKMKDLDITKTNAGTISQYKSIINRLQHAYYSKMINPENHYFLFNTRTEFEKYLFYHSYENNNGPIYFSQSESFKHVNLTKQESEFRGFYDAVIYFPFTQVSIAFTNRERSSD